MIVKINRCKHCGKEYEYYVSGVFVCPKCGYMEDRDIHAAKNMVWLYKNIPYAEHIQDFAEIKNQLDVIFPSMFLS